MRFSLWRQGGRTSISAGCRPRRTSKPFGPRVGARRPTSWRAGWPRLGNPRIPRRRGVRATRFSVSGSGSTSGAACSARRNRRLCGRGWGVACCAIRSRIMRSLSFRPGPPCRPTLRGVRCPPLLRSCRLRGSRRKFCKRCCRMITRRRTGRWRRGPRRIFSPRWRRTTNSSKNSFAS